MATAEEILATMPQDASEYEEVCTVDLSARTIEIPEKLKIVGVESDEDVTRRKFRMFWQYGDIDLAEFSVKINYENAKGEGGIFPVSDVARAGEDMTFSWLLSRKALKYKGNIRFVVCMTQASGAEIVKEWNSTIAEFKVLEGLEIDGDIDEDADSGGGSSGGGGNVPSAVSFFVDDDGNATLSGAALTVDANGNGTLSGEALDVEPDGDGNVG